MRIVLYKPLVRPEYKLDSFWSHYLGFSSIRAYLISNEDKYSVSIVTTPEAIVSARPDIVGISSVSEMWEISKNIIVWLRRNGFKGLIVMGGPHITAVPETLPLGADCAVLGEGERAFLELVRVYDKYRSFVPNDILGIAYRNHKGELIRNGPRPLMDMNLLPVDFDVNPSICFQISTVRGCPFSCLHCVEPSIQNRVRYLSAERLLFIMKKRLALSANPNFFFQDDTFLAARGRLEELHGLMRRQNLLGKFKIKSVSLNANLVEDNTIPLLKEIGVRSLWMGVESLNPRVLSVMKSGQVTLAHIDKTIHSAQKSGLPIGGSQVYGLRGETREEMVDSIMRVREYERTTSFRHWVVYVCQPLVGSRFWQEELARGNVSLDMDFSSLRIDGDCRYFKVPWYYGNEEYVPRQDFINILKQYKMLPSNFFVPPHGFQLKDVPRNIIWFAERLRQSIRSFVPRVIIRGRK